MYSSAVIYEYEEQFSYLKYSFDFSLYTLINRKFYTLQFLVMLHQLIVNLLFLLFSLKVLNLSISLLNVMFHLIIQNECIHQLTNQLKYFSLFN